MLVKLKTSHSLLVLLIPAFLYTLTLDTGLRPDELMGGDLITHQYAQVQARPSNAPGYPLYVMLGWLWYRISWFFLRWAFNPIQLLSLYSTWWSLASLWVLYKLLSRSEVTGQNQLLSILLTLFYAVTYFFWYYSVTTEQYSSAIFQTLLIVWLALIWEQKPTNQTLYLMAFVSGTMLANMLTTLFILPPLFYLIFSRRWRILTDIVLVLKTSLIGLLPLLSYVYIYLRGAQHPEWRGVGQWESNWAWFLDFLSTRQGRDELASGLTWQNLITPEFPALIWQELTWPVLIGGLIGWTLLSPRLTIFFYGTLMIYGLFITAYRFGNWFQVILPVYPLIVIGFGRSVAWVWEKGLRDSPPWRGGLIPPVILRSVSLAAQGFQENLPLKGVKGAISLLLISLIIYRFSLSYARADQSYLQIDTGLNPSWTILADLAERAEPSLTLTATHEEWVALQYLQTVWRMGPALHLNEPSLPASWLTRQAAQVFPHLVDLSTMHPQAYGGNLIHLSSEPMITLPNAQAVDLAFGEQIRLLSYKINQGIDTQDKTQPFIISLYWTAETDLDQDYTISVRPWQRGMPIQGSDGILQQDHQPVWNTYPTSYWRPQTVIADAYTFDLPPSVKPDQLHVVLYRQTETGFENLADHVIQLSSIAD